MGQLKYQCFGVNNSISARHEFQFKAASKHHAVTLSRYTTVNFVVMSCCETRMAIFHHYKVESLESDFESQWIYIAFKRARIEFVTPLSRSRSHIETLSIGIATV